MSQNSLVLPTTGTVSGLQMTQNMNNALDTLNTLASGASSPGSPEAGQLWHDTTSNLLRIRDLANTTWIVIGAIDETNKLFSAYSLPVITPQGRLTLVSSTPVMTADATAQTAVYYTPYAGDIVPVYNGANFINTVFSQLTLTLNITNHLGGKLYDVFIFVNAGALTLGASPAWTSGMARSAALTQLNGIWVNSASINLTNGSITYSSVAASEATYLGTFYATANGQTGVAFKPAAATGGSGNIIGLFNAYNRVRAIALCRDAKANWTYAAAAWRTADSSTANSIAWVDGLQQVNVKAVHNAAVTFGANGNSYYIGTCLDSTTASPNIAAYGLDVANAVQNMTQAEAFYPQLGFHYIQAMEYSAIGTQTVNASGITQSLQWEGEY